MKRKLLALAGLLLVAAAGGWFFFLVGPWTQRLPPGWKWEARFIGASSYPDEKTGAFPPKDTINVYDREVTLADESGRPNAVVIEDRYTTYERDSKKITWEYVLRSTVDPRTGAHVNPDHGGDVAVFPRNTEKRSYSLRLSYLKGIPVHFEREETVEGLLTYVFSYKGRGEYTESYEGSPRYPGIKVQPGQEIKCADDQFSLRLWVEPVTGEIVKVEESAPSGDWIYEIATGKKVAPVLRWSGATAGDDVIRRVATIARERRRILWTAYYLPLLLLGTGLACLAFALMGTWKACSASGSNP